MNPKLFAGLALAVACAAVLPSLARAQPAPSASPGHGEVGVRHVRACYAAARSKLSTDKRADVSGPCASDATPPKPDWIFESKVESGVRGLRVLVKLQDGTQVSFDGNRFKEFGAVAGLQRADGCFGGWFTPETCCYRGYCCKWVGSGSPNCG